MWKRYLKLYRLVVRGVPPARAAAVAGIPDAALDGDRVVSLVRRAEAVFQTRMVLAIGSGSHTRVTRAKDEVGRERSGQIWERVDWKAHAFLLERRHPGEWGPSQPAQVTETVVQVLGALAALRQQPASLDALRHRPQLEIEAQVKDEAGPTA